jgi:hypothetical protein
MSIRIQYQHKNVIDTFMSNHNFASLSAITGEVSAWNTRLPKPLKEQLISTLLKSGANVACLRNKGTNQLEGEYFLTFYTDNQDLSGTEAYRVMMQQCKASKMFLDVQFSE